MTPEKDLKFTLIKYLISKGEMTLSSIIMYSKIVYDKKYQFTGIVSNQRNMTINIKVPVDMKETMDNNIDILTDACFKIYENDDEYAATNVSISVLASKVTDEEIEYIQKELEENSYSRLRGNNNYNRSNTNNNYEGDTVKEKALDKTKVFIVHGHDDLAKLGVARFVEKLGLEAIILHEQANSGNTIIEKIEEYSSVGFGIVIYTPCDIGNSKEKKDQLNLRARQNVVFEHGYLIGKIGRKNVCALVRGDVEKPNDISGVVYINMDEYGAWQTQLVREMKRQGYNIDANNLF